MSIAPWLALTAFLTYLFVALVHALFGLAARGGARWSAGEPPALSAATLAAVLAAAVCAFDGTALGAFVAFAGLLVAAWHLGAVTGEDGPARATRVAGTILVFVAFLLWALCSTAAALGAFDEAFG